MQKNLAAVPMPDLETLKKIVSSANQAPSGDNCQPWTFVLKNSNLEIHFIEERAESIFDSGHYAALLALGMVLESVKIASLHFGYIAEVKVTYDPLKPELPWGICSFSESKTVSQDDLYDWLSKRCVDRRIYGGKNLNHEVFDQIEALADVLPNIRIHLLNKPILKFFWQISKAEIQVWKDKRAHSGLFRWLRFKEYGDIRGLDGMPWKSLGIVKIQAVLLELCKNFRVQKIANFLGFILQIRILVLVQLLKCTSLICFTMKTDNTHEIVNAGQIAMQVWLRLQRAGFGVQPISSISHGSYMANHIKKSDNDRLLNELEKGTRFVRNAFNIPQNEFPIWMFRTGPSPELPHVCRSKRLPIEKIFKSE